MAMNEYGFQTSLSGNDCYLDRLDEFKSDGMSCVEIWFREDYEAESSLFEAALKRISDAGLFVWSIHLPFGESVNPAAISEEGRKDCVKKLKRFIDLSEKSGAKIFVIHGSFEPIDLKDRESAVHSAITSLKELSEYLSHKGLRLALENLPRTCIGNASEEIGYISSQIPELRLCFDTNHFTPEKPNYIFRRLQRLSPKLRSKMNPLRDEPTLYAEAFADKIVTLHISDYDGIDECHWLPGQGIIDFSAIHSALVRAGFSSPIIFEPNEHCRGVLTTAKRLIEGYEKAILHSKR